jgi:hypothetical protein
VVGWLPRSLSREPSITGKGETEEPAVDSTASRRKSCSRTYQSYGWLRGGALLASARNLEAESKFLLLLATLLVPIPGVGNLNRCTEYYTSGLDQQ